MRPLDPLAPLSPLAKLLAGAPAAEVRAEIARLAALALDPEASAALAFARGALALREGTLDDARADLDLAARAFADPEAAALARAEALIAAVRRGPRAAIAEAARALDAISAAPATPLVRATALHYRGAAERALGDAEAAMRSLLAAFAKAEPFLDQRARILSSLGTLHVALGSLGAAGALLQHAAELHHQLGDAVGEAIAHGQLGAAALSMGELDDARRHLQRQEWLASRTGDPQGQARALVFLAEVALDARRPAEAVDLADRALAVATSVDPPLSLFVAYATRARGRARLELGDLAAARADGAAAHEAFARYQHPLGLALTAWDEARLDVEEGRPASFFEPAWALASLGLAPRVARLFADRRALGVAGPDEDDALAAVAETAPHLAAEEEARQIHAAPGALEAIAARRTAARRNLGRLAALSIAPRGLVVAAIAAETIGAGRRALPDDRASAAAVAEIPGAAVWVWPERTPPEAIARDLARARASLGPSTRAAVARRAEARVRSAPMPGEVGATVEGVDLGALLAGALGLAAGALMREPEVAWSTEADAAIAASW